MYQIEQGELEWQQLFAWSIHISFKDAPVNSVKEALALSISRQKECKNEDKESYSFCRRPI